MRDQHPAFHSTTQISTNHCNASRIGRNDELREVYRAKIGHLDGVSVRLQFGALGYDFLYCRTQKSGIGRPGREVLLAQRKLRTELPVLRQSLAQRRVGLTL